MLAAYSHIPRQNTIESSLQAIQMLTAHLGAIFF